MVIEEEPTLKPVALVVSYRDYLRDTWARRGFWISVPSDDLKAKNRATVLGRFWLLLNPAIEIFIYYLIFGLLLQVDRGLGNFIGFLAVGLVTFSLTARALPLAAALMLRNLPMIRTLQFPRAVLPLATSMSNFFTFLPALPVMLITVLLTGEPLRWQWIMVVPAVLIAVAFSTGAILIVARIGRGFADLEPIVGHMVRLLLYMSGVLYEPSRWTSRDDVLAVFNANPFYEMNTIVRAPLLTDVTASAGIWAGATAWAIGSLTFGMWFFYKGESSYGA